VLWAVAGNWLLLFPSFLRTKVTRWVGARGFEGTQP
jgi:hypothetical protein